VSDERDSEQGFFARQGGGTATPERARRRLAWGLSPVVALAAVLVAGWLLFILWPDVAYFASPRAPIDLGGPGAYRLEAARENRLVQVRGELVDPVAVSEGRSGAPRTVGRLEGTNLLVDRPGRTGPPVYEGRLLPAAGRDAYAAVADVLRQRGTPLGGGFRVLRDGERPRRQWLPVLGALLVVVVLALNLRAFLGPLLTRREER